MTMRERMAVALFDRNELERYARDSEARATRGLPPNHTTRLWTNVNESVRKEVFKLVDACLNFLTARPSERMISAGLQECTHAAFVMDADDVQRVYEAMTAAMIEEWKK